MTHTDPVPTAEQISAIRSTHIDEYPDFPEPGVLFRDITPVLRDARAMRDVIRYWAALLPADVEFVVGTEARGFVFGAPLAYEIGAGFIPVRKAGKLPGNPTSHSYDLEYGSATVQIPETSLPAGARTVVVDDLLATGGTAAATVALTRRFGVDLLGASFLIELQGLAGREQLADVPVTTVWSFPN